MSTIVANNPRNVRLIGVVSVVIPLAVAVLIFMPARLQTGEWVKFLPHLNAVINSATSMLLLLGLYFIKRNQIDYHRAVMLAAFTLGACFLVSYIIYHASVSSAIYGDMNGDGVLSDAERSTIGGLRTIYLAVLLSHIGLSAIVVPLVLSALYFALSDQNVRHRRVVRFAYPIWLYVSISGVAIYLMISPFYN